MIEAITQSIVNQIGRCPVQFEFRHIKGLIVPPGVAARKGSAAHKGAEIAHRYRVDHNNANPPVELIQDTTRDEFLRLVNDEGVIIPKEDLYVEGKNKILANAQDQAILLAKSYVENYLTNWVDKIALFEKRLYADVGIGIPISGKPDLVADGINNDVKTSGMRWTDGAERFEVQPTMYRLLLRENGFGVLDSRYTVLTNMSNGPAKNIHDGTIWDTENRVCIDVLDTERTDEDEKKLIYKLEIYIEMIEKGLFPPCRQGKGSWWCSPRYCGYYSMCKYT